MAVTVVTRWSTPNVAASTELAKRSKALWVRHGALDARLSQIFTGQFTGQYIYAVVYADMAAYAKALAGAGAELQQLIADNVKLGAVLQEREILVGVDI